MSRRQRTLTAAVLLVAAGLAVVLWPAGPQPVAPRAVEGGAAAAGPAAAAAQTAPPVELGSAPVFESLDTTVVFPLEVVLELAALDGADETQQRLGARSRLSGVVIGPGGEGTRCEVRFVGGMNAGRVLFSDGLGRFGANDLYPGLALVHVVGAGGGALREVRLRQEREALLNLSFARTAVVNGKVVGPDGQGVADARVQLDGQPATTDGKGAFFLSGIAAGEAVLTVEKPGLAAARTVVAVPLGGSVEPDKLTVALQRGARLTVSVDEPINSGSEALVYLSSETSGAERRYPWHKVSPVKVWPGGQTTIEDLPPGPLALRLYHAGAKANPARTQVSLSEGEEETVVLHLEPAPVVAGVVKSRGQPARDAVVRLETPDRVASMLGSYGQQNWLHLEGEVYTSLPSAVQEIRTNARGEFSLSSYEDLSAKRFLTAVSADGRSRAALLLKGGETRVELELQEVRAGTSAITLRLPDRWQALPVRITVNGEPRDPFLLAPGRDLDVEGLPRGEWLLSAHWNGEGVVEKRTVALQDEAALDCPLPEGAIAGQDEDTRRRAGAR